ncbi:MAG: hypothetical protein FWD88_00475 [Treponema sp.]|nr:hypothetical protein [Treponema sp.]
MNGTVFKFVCAFAMLAFALPAHAQHYGNHGWNWESRDTYAFSANISIKGLGIGPVVSLETYGNPAVVEGSIVWLGLGTEHNRTRLGMMFSPPISWLHFDNNFDPPRDFLGENLTHISFINMTVYWNMLSRRFGGTSMYPPQRVADVIYHGMFLGPFASANYIFLDTVANRFRWDGYMFTAGLRAGIRMEVANLNMDVFSVEAGFRLVNGRNNFVVTTRMDLLTFLAFWLSRGVPLDLFPFGP